MKEKLHVLHIEDSKEDSDLVRKILSTNGIDCQMTRIETRSQVFDALENNSYDLILADCKLPNFSGLHALEIAHALKPETPFVFVSGTIGEETAIDSLRNGATDYVLKDRLSRLVPAVRRAMAEAEERTQHRQLQHRLHEAGRLEAISTLSNGVAHDFNNILTIILGHASLLTMEHDHPQRVLEISHTISQAARRGSEVVQQLMAFARKSEGRGVPTDLNHYIRENLERLKGKLPEKIELIFQPTGKLPGVMADPRQMERILINLVSNSIESMPQGGTITLSTELVTTAALPDLLPDLASGNYVCLKIADTGAGMDSLTREHVFEPFYTTKDRGRGTGLGLPVVYGLMQSQSGYIDVKSELGVGTVISLYFPVPNDGTENVATVVRPSNAALQGTETILVVEDEPDVSFFIETILQSHGYHVLPAADYEHAVTLFKAHRDEIQLVFSDVGLPRVDGITLCAELKTLKPSLHVVLASGYSPKEFKDRINDVGVGAFLGKPFQTPDILQTVRKVLDGSRVLHLA